MAEPRPAYFRPALIAGSVAGLLSGLPVISAGNCFCCLWIIGGAAAAVRILARETAAPLTPGDGALTGALTGIVAAVVQAIVSLPFRSFDPEQYQRVLDWLSGIGITIPPETIEQASRMASTFRSPGWFLLSLLITAVAMCLIGCLVGVIGMAIFAKKAAPPGPASPAAPAPPPPSPPGPTDAA